MSLVWGDIEKLSTSYGAGFYLAARRIDPRGTGGAAHHGARLRVPPSKLHTPTVCSAGLRLHTTTATPDQSSRYCDDATLQSNVAVV